MKYLLLLTLALWASYSNAQIYSCKTADGKTSFQAQPCDAGAVQTEKLATTTTTVAGDVNPPGCNHPLLGRWRQSQYSKELDKDLISDASQQWTFAADGTLEHKGLIVQTLPYTCVGDIVTFKSMVENQLEIVRSTPSTMVWRSIDFGGYIYVIR